MLETLKQFALNRVAGAVILALICLVSVKLILGLFDRVIRRSKLDFMVHTILRVALKIALLFVALIIVLGSLGISVSSLVAALSVVGVALSLAIQGFLSNVFGGIQIISNKPFVPGDFVDAGGESGIVREVGLFYTKLDTPDKKLIQVPNSTIANSNIINYSSAENRRVDFNVAVSYDNDIETVKSVLLQLLTTHPLTLSGGDFEPVAHVSDYQDNTVNYTARAWCKSEDYWTVYFDVMDALKPTFEEHAIAFTFPNVNVRLVEQGQGQKQ